MTRRVWYWVEHTRSFPGNTGIQRVTRGLARGLQECGYDLQFVAWDKSRLNFCGVDALDLENLARWGGPDVSAGSARFVSPEGRRGWLIIPELTTYPDAPDLGLVIERARAAGLRVATVFYDAIPVKLAQHYAKPQADLHAAYMEALSKADVVLAISETSRQDLLGFLYGKLERTASLDAKAITVALPGELPGIPRAAVGDDARQSDERVVLCIATVEPRKNHEILIRAFRRANERLGNRLKLVLIGSDPFPELARRVEREIADDGRISWLKTVDDAALADWYRRCEFTVYPSTEEGYGLPVAESLWFARPCVCHNASSMAEIAQSGGCLPVDVGNAEALEQAIFRLASDGATQQRLKKEATTRPIKRWREYAEEILDRLEWCGGKRSLHKEVLPAGRAEGRGPLKSPLLSVCISTYNRAGWLDVALRTALEMTKPFADVVEVLVVDNASGDDTPSVAQRYAAAPNLRYLRNPENVGMLGNLRVTANAARGEYIWILGDDDILMPTAIERVLWAIATLQDVPLIYLNYAYTRLDAPPSGLDVAGVYDAAIPISGRVADELADEVRSIAANSENCFTAIYTCVFRRDHGVAAYSMDTSGPPFSSLRTCVPSAVYVTERLFHEAGLWLGQPCIAVNMNVSWGRYAPLFVLERLPELYDVMEAKGADPARLDTIRQRNLPGVFHFLEAIFSGDAPEAAGGVSFESVVRRFKHLREFRDRIPGLLKAYDKALAAGRLAPGSAPANAIAKRYGLD